MQSKSMKEESELCNTASVRVEVGRRKTQTRSRLVSPFKSLAFSVSRLVLIFPSTRVFNCGFGHSNISPRVFPTFLRHRYTFIRYVSLARSASQANHSLLAPRKFLMLSAGLLYRFILMILYGRHPISPLTPLPP